jgi:hypothetical protein
MLLIVVLVLTVYSVLGAEPVADPGSRGVDWERVKSRVGVNEWAAAVVRDMERDVRAVMVRYANPPLGKTGWFHEYFCDDDAQRLVFDPEKPHEHVCPGCGRVYTGAPYDDCWRASVHREIISATADAAVLYRITGEKTYFDHARKILLWYADNYEKFEVHGDHAGKGRIHEQSLDEATQLVSLTQAYWDIRPDLTPAERAGIVEKFLLPDAKFIHAQTRVIHNIHSWHNAAVGLVGFAVGDKELVAAAMDGPHGLKQQIQKGVKDDGFWYEGSISYHFYTVSSLQPLYMAARAQGYALEGTEKFRLMYTAPVDFTFDNGEFPANNDGWPEKNIRTLASYYEVAAGFWNDPRAARLLDTIYRGGRRSGINALLYGPDALSTEAVASSRSDLFAWSGAAFLRNDAVNAYLKFGPYGGGHDHNDRLNLILFAKDHVIIPDLGTSGYGIALNGKWFRASAAHNMLVVDGRRQANRGGYLVSYTENAVTAGVKDAYRGVDIQRSISLLEKGIEDVVSVESEEVHQYDLFYHIRGTLETCSVPLEPAPPFNASNGYDMLKELRTGVREKECEITWRLRDTRGGIRIKAVSTRPFEVFVGTCPDNPANKQQSFVMLRRKDTAARWTSEMVIVE